MVIKPQKTNFQIFIVGNLKTIKVWAINPWRRLSLALIVFFLGYFFGSSLGMVSAVYELMDPVGALISVIFIELLISFRRNLFLESKQKLYLLLTDCLRIGLFYGFFTEGLKLL